MRRNGSSKTPDCMLSDKRKGVLWIRVWARPLGMTPINRVYSASTRVGGAFSVDCDFFKIRFNPVVLHKFTSFRNYKLMFLGYPHGYRHSATLTYTQNLPLLQASMLTPFGMSGKTSQFTCYPRSSNLAQLELTPSPVRGEWVPTPGEGLVMNGDRRHPWYEVARCCLIY